MDSVKLEAQPTETAVTEFFKNTGVAPIFTGTRPYQSENSIDASESLRSWRKLANQPATTLHQGRFCDNAGRCGIGARLLGAILGVFGRRHPECGIDYFGKTKSPADSADLAGIWGFEMIGCVSRTTECVVRAPQDDKWVLGYDFCDLGVVADRQIAIWNTDRPRDGGFLLPVWTSPVGSRPARLGIKVDDSHVHVAVQFWDGTLVTYALLKPQLSKVMPSPVPAPARS